MLGIIWCLLGLCWLLLGFDIFYQDELEGKLKAVNRGGAPAAADSSTSSATKAQLNEVKGELKSMRLEQQKLQVEILKAKKEKTQLEIEINKLKLRNGA